MARPLRIEYSGAVYHVMARGNQGQPIFRDDKDRWRFLETLGEAAEKTGWRIHAYVLMGWVTQAVSRLKRKPGKKMEKFKRQLQHLNERDE